jgi:hypothetical protein
MPGLLRGVARTAVIAGTASAVSGRVQRRQAEKFAARDQQIAANRAEGYYAGAQTAQQQYAAPPQAPPAAAPPVDVATQLEKLGDLKERGLLTDAEFAAEKAKILGM